MVKCDKAARGTKEVNLGKWKHARGLRGQLTSGTVRAWRPRYPKHERRSLFKNQTLALVSRTMLKTSLEKLR